MSTLGECYNHSMAKRVRVLDENNQEGAVTVDQFPDDCPVCGVGINAKAITGSELPSNHDTDYLQVIFKCPMNDCQRMFLGYFSRGRIYGSEYFLNKRGIIFPHKEAVFPEIIGVVSPEFSKIYNQAETAEENGLNEICGPGYRKALEFLIKDYLIYLDSDSKDKITKTLLGDVIKTLEDGKIKACAKRAAWLGNDETHYYRKWESQDITSLKDLIKLTINWIENAEITKKYIEEMPESQTTTP